MEINKAIELIENFAPLELQQKWDNSGWQLTYQQTDIKKILLCVSITENIINQAIEENCDLIIAHHPLFFVPFSFNKNIPIYSAHTNLDTTDGGTTDTLIKLLGFTQIKKIGEFLRIVELKKEIYLSDFSTLLKSKLKLENLRIVNNLNQQKIQTIAFCAGSGADFINDATEIGADIIVTGDVKYHTALDSHIIIADVGHFESEYPVLTTLKDLLKKLNIEVTIANEKSPFINY